MQADFNVDTAWCLEQLYREALISERDQYLVSTTPRSAAQLSWHALQWIASFKLVQQQTQTILDVPELCHWLAAKAQLALYQIDPLSLDVTALTQVMSQEFAIKNHILAVELRTDTVVIGTTQPFNQEWCQHLAHSLAPKKIERVLLDPEQMHRYQLELYRVNQAVHGSQHNKMTKLSMVGEAVLNSVQPQALDTESEEQHIVKLLDWLLQFALEQRASDMHLEPRQDKGNVRFRIDGLLHTVYRMPLITLNAVIARIKILGLLDVAEKRRPQDGRLKMCITEQQEIELRLSTLPTAHGEKMVLRLFNPEVLLRDLSQLGFDQELLSTWQHLIQSKHGMILVTGPTGSGKTTTLYSTLKHCASEHINVCSIEDPIEMLEHSFNQMQVNPTIDLGFAQGIRALMRQDPDIIMVGEIRDSATAQMAIQAALTGHLVFSTLHTNDAASSLIRLHDLGVQAFLTAATLLGVLAQRLLRRLCPHCKQQITLDQYKWQYLTREYVLPQPQQIYQAKGCAQCRHTGFIGRVGIYEFMPMTLGLKQQLNHTVDLDQLRTIARRDGVVPLRIAAARQVLLGETCLQEVLNVVAVDDE